MNTQTLRIIQNKLECISVEQNVCMNFVLCHIITETSQHGYLLINNDAILGLESEDRSRPSPLSRFLVSLPRYNEFWMKLLLHTPPVTSVHLASNNLADMSSNCNAQSNPTLYYLIKFYRKARPHNKINKNINMYCITLS